MKVNSEKRIDVLDLSRPPITLLCLITGKPIVEKTCGNSGIEGVNLPKGRSYTVGKEKHKEVTWPRKKRKK